MDKFENTMIRVEGVAGIVPLWYVGRRNKPLLWNPEEDSESKIERIIYQCRCIGPEFEEDNKTFYAFVEESCVGTPAQDIIKEFEASQDGQAALEAVRNAFEQGDKKEERVKTATDNIGHGELGLTFHHQGAMTFMKYSSHLKDSYYVLSRKGAKYTDSNKVKRLLEGMKGNFSTSVVNAMNKCSTTYRDRFNHAVMHIKAALSHPAPHYVIPCEVHQDACARDDAVGVNVAPELHNHVERQSESPYAGPHGPTFGGCHGQRFCGSRAPNHAEASNFQPSRNPWTWQNWHRAFNLPVERHMRNNTGQFGQPNFCGGRSGRNIIRGYGPRNHGQPHRAQHY